MLIFARFSSVRRRDVPSTVFSSFNRGDANAVPTPGLHTML
jgi:hypothetical protein